MKKISKLRKFWNRLEALSNTGKIILVFSLLLSMAMCSQAGWIGYYGIKKPDDSWNVVGINTDNGVVLEFPKEQEFWLELPINNSFFKLAGVITPFTPPIPIFFFRSWDGTDFTIQSKPSATIKLKLEDVQGREANSKTHEDNFKSSEAKTYNPQVTEGSYGYTRYTFPIKSKNLDSGTLIIEKDGEVIEVPFEYKYQKFWR